MRFIKTTSVMVSLTLVAAAVVSVAGNASSLEATDLVCSEVVCPSGTGCGTGCSCSTVSVMNAVGVNLPVSNVLSSAKARKLTQPSRYKQLCLTDCNPVDCASCASCNQVVGPITVPGLPVDASVNVTWACSGGMLVSSNNYWR